MGGGMGGGMGGMGGMGGDAPIASLGCCLGVWKQPPPPSAPSAPSATSTTPSAPSATSATSSATAASRFHPCTTTDGSPYRMSGSDGWRLIIATATPGLGIAAADPPPYAAPSSPSSSFSSSEQGHTAQRGTAQGGTAQGGSSQGGSSQGGSTSFWVGTAMAAPVLVGSAHSACCGSIVTSCGQLSTSAPSGPLSTFPSGQTGQTSSQHTLPPGCMTGWLGGAWVWERPLTPEEVAALHKVRDPELRYLVITPSLSRDEIVALHKASAAPRTLT